jgi:hypothetical protein
MDLVRAKAGRQRRIGEVDRFRFLAYEQNPRRPPPIVDGGDSSDYQRR